MSPHPSPKVWILLIAATAILIGAAFLRDKAKAFFNEKRIQLSTPPAPPALTERDQITARAHQIFVTEWIRSADGTSLQKRRTQPVSPPLPGCLVAYRVGAEAMDHETMKREEMQLKTIAQKLDAPGIDVDIIRETAAPWWRVEIREHQQRRDR